MGFSRRMSGFCVAVACIVGLWAIPVASAKSRAGAYGTRDNGSCVLGNGSGRIKHVIYLQFDNVHLRRDNPNVPSDLEQMPHLLNFLKGNGTVLNKQYTVLISHTAAGITSSLTGLYPDRMGLTESNSYDYYQSNGIPTFTSAFKYWTSPVSATDSLPNMVNGDSGQPKTAPAPWVSYTRDGCDVGNVSVANTVLENNSIAPGGDIANVYGNPSPEASEPAALRTTDFVGIAVHCAQVQTSVCNNQYGRLHAKPDPLPDEPGGYDNYSALFGAKYVDPAITGGQAAVNDINGSPITDSSGNPGFPGFDSMSAANTLGYVAQMQEAGIPVTFAYISDLHDNHAGGGAYGPGEKAYVDALKSYDDAFGKFFARLARDGINKSNTLFVVTADENDHFAGQQAQNCDGVNVPCQYNTAPGQASGGKPMHGIFDLTNGASASSDPSAWNGPSTWPPAGVNGPLVADGLGDRWVGLRHLVRFGARVLHQRAATGRGCERRRRRESDPPGVRAEGGEPEGVRPVHRRDEADTRGEVPRRRADAQGPAHDQRRSGPDLVVHDVLAARLLLPDVQPVPHGPGMPERWVRVYPRRLRPERHRADVARSGRPGRAR